MAITPSEISNKDFKRNFRGYDMDEVDTFLDAIREDYEKVYKLNSTLREQVTVLREKVEQYATMESTLQNTLVLAQTASQQVKENSEKEANILIKEAEREAEIIIKDAEKKTAEINKEYEFMKQQFNAFKSRFKGMVESQLEVIEKIEIETGIMPASILDENSQSESPSKEDSTKREDNQNPDKEVLSQEAKVKDVNEVKAKDSNEAVKKDTRPYPPKGGKKPPRKDMKKDNKDNKDRNKFNTKKIDKVEKIEA